MVVSWSQIRIVQSQCLVDPFPCNKWEDVAIDFLGPIGKVHYILVIVDHYSMFLEVKIMAPITTSATIKRPSKIFTRFGYPRTITLDNAKQFASEELSDWCRDRGIELVHSISYWPQSNGECERQSPDTQAVTDCASTMR